MKLFITYPSPNATLTLLWVKLFITYPSPNATLTLLWVKLFITYPSPNATLTLTFSLWPKSGWVWGGEGRPSKATRISKRFWETAHHFHHYLLFIYSLPYGHFFGGVEALSREHFELINGFSNIFWGWGGEDDNLYFR